MMRVVKGEEKKKKEERIFKEIMAINFPALRKDMNLHIKEAE